MRIISGLNYYYKLEEMIKECINNARNNLFDQYIFICEDKKFVESLFFKYTDCLINIEIMSFRQYLNYLVISNHLTNVKLIDNIEICYYLRDILLNDNLKCFNVSNPYPVINSLIPLMKELELNNTVYDVDNSKLDDYMYIYRKLKSLCKGYFTLEGIVSGHINNSGNHIYIEGDHLFESLRYNIIKELDINNDVCVMYTCNKDDRLFNLAYKSYLDNSICVDNDNHVTNNLFNKSVNKSNEVIYSFKESNASSEVKRVVYKIKELIVDKGLKYSDFVIAYGDSSYSDLIKTELDFLRMPHNIPNVSKCYYDRNYKNIIRYLSEHDGSLSVNKYVSLFSDLDSNYRDYFSKLSDFNITMSYKEFLDFFVSSYKYETKEVLKSKDCVIVDEVGKLRYSDKYVFILGMNEGSMPKYVKDDGLLLDEDIELLRNNGISTCCNTIERDSIVENDILKALCGDYKLLCVSYSVSTLGGEKLIESSLFKQLKEMFVINELPLNKFIAINEFYMNNGMLDEYELLNDNIHHYIISKNQPSVISSNIIDKLYSKTFSVSQIETYNKCPFQYFIKYGLNIKEPKEDGLLPNEIGSLVHYILEKMVGSNKNLDEVISEYLNNNEPLYNKIKSSNSNKYFLNEIKSNAKIILKVLEYYNSKSSFNISNKELKINDSINGISFKGIVDRVDETSDYVNIIDYKSSDKDIDIDLARIGFNIQMLVYMEIVSKLNNKLPGAMLYFNMGKRKIDSNESIYNDIDNFYNNYQYLGLILNDEEVINSIDNDFNKKSDVIKVKYVNSKKSYSGNIINNDELNSLFEDINNYIAYLYNMMNDGNIGITPKGSDDSTTDKKVNPCTYCKFKSICGYDSFYNEHVLVDEMLNGGDNSGL